MHKTVWIIDDDRGILEVTQIVLQEAGFNVLALDSQDALNMQLEKKVLPDMILLDILISGADGRDISKKLKSNPSTQQIPVIMMSADTNIEEKCKEAKADGFIKKPFDIDQLEKTVKKYTQKK